MPIIPILAALVFCQDAERFILEDPKRQNVEADYLILCPGEWTDAVAPLASYRAQNGYISAIVRSEDIFSAFGSKTPSGEAVLEFILHARGWKRSPKFFLIVGDAAGRRQSRTIIPTLTKRSDYQTKTYANDEELASDHFFACPTDSVEPDLRVGRFPADTLEEVRIMVEKTLTYEKAPAGPWQKRTAFLMGQGSFGEFVDGQFERLFSKIIGENLPPLFELELAYANPDSPYCPYPPRFHENALRMLNEGALFTTYIGHGYRRGFDTLSWRDRNYPIFDAEQVDSVDARNALPIMVVLACSTGYLDSVNEDCIGEELMKRPRGPVAFVGGSRITQPYPNALFGQALIAAVCSERCDSMGEAILRAKRRLLAKDDSSLRKQADILASLFQGPGSLEPMRRDAVFHYNLFGDPALKIRRPNEDIVLDKIPDLQPGRPLTIHGRSGTISAGTVRATLECSRTAFTRKLPEVNEEETDVEKQMKRRYRAANDKVLCSAQTTLTKGAFTISLDLPERMKLGTYFLKIDLLGEMEFATVARERDLR